MRVTGWALALAITMTSGAALADSCSGSTTDGSVSCDNFYPNASPSATGQDVATDIANLTVTLFPYWASSFYADSGAKPLLDSGAGGSYTLDRSSQATILDGSFPTVLAKVIFSRSAGNYYALLDEVFVGVLPSDFSSPTSADLVRSTSTLFEGATWPAAVVVDHYATAVAAPGPVAGVGLPALLGLLGLLGLRGRLRRAR